MGGKGGGENITTANQNIFYVPLRHVFGGLLFRNTTQAERLMPDHINNVYFQIIPI